MKERSLSDDELVEKMEEALREPPPHRFPITVDSFSKTADIPVGKIYELPERSRRTPSIHFLPYVFPIGDKKPEGENT